VGVPVHLQGTTEAGQVDLYLLACGLIAGNNVKGDMQVRDSSPSSEQIFAPATGPTAFASPLVLPL
jgi:hypothetical protein